MKRIIALLLAALVMCGMLFAVAEDGEALASADTAVESSEDSTGEALPDPELMNGLDLNAIDAKPIEVWFEEGFGLELPYGWVSYPVSAEDQTAGVRYALGDNDDHYLYIDVTATSFDGLEVLSQAIEEDERFAKSGDLNFDGSNFAAFIDSERNALCCATILGSSMVTFIFTPQTDSDYMLTATQIMETFVTA